MERKGSDKHPRLLGTSMRYGAGYLSGGRAPWDGPSPLSSPLARVARHSRDTTEKRVRMGDASVGGKEVEGSPGETPVLCKRSPSSSQFSVLRGQY